MKQFWTHQDGSEWTFDAPHDTPALAISWRCPCCEHGTITCIDHGERKFGCSATSMLAHPMPDRWFDLSGGFPPKIPPKVIVHGHSGSGDEVFDMEPVA